jgi:tRNA threonylcarbamoyladenosine biosynthesis protein TsaE
MTRIQDITLPDADATAALAARVAQTLAAGDTILLAGPTGAGKSHFARSVIQTLQAQAGQPVEDVPSPTYTLVQTYQAGALEIWHADLYRLGDTSELEELGLTTAWDDALTLIEWPDRLGDLLPRERLDIQFEHASDPTSRSASLSGTGDWADRLKEVDLV